MKLISLNTWGCRITDQLFSYIKQNSESTDIFCFQEILKDGSGKTHREELKSGFQDIASLLPNHTPYFLEYGDGGYYTERSKDLDFKYGIACYVKSDLKQDFVSGVNLLDKDRKWNDYSGQFAAGTALAISIEGHVIVNVHGLWQGSIKTDTEAKLEQSRKIIELAESASGKKIICGDFNLLPDTQSLQMLRDKYSDLIKENGIISTRSSLYPKPIRFSDYVFVDKQLIINNFSVPNLDISDHLPLTLDFE